jgi:quercetin dioxygenase-like cupin family protein
MTQELVKEFKIKLSWTKSAKDYMDIPIFSKSDPSMSFDIEFGNIDVHASVRRRSHAIIKCKITKGTVLSPHYHSDAYHIINVTKGHLFERVTDQHITPGRGMTFKKGQHHYLEALEDSEVDALYYKNAMEMPLAVEV